MTKKIATTENLSRLQVLLHMLANLAEEGMDMRQILETTGSLRRAVFRMFTDAERDLKVQVKFSRATSRYHVVSWGVLSCEQVVDQYRDSPSEHARKISRVVVKAASQSENP